ncbi:hypothetical protein FAZ69_20090 [Trinickia terrae]|uniref:Uncharacterized protein n=1 Tax=Trinickia terrae TaxID=2571161 RepID=A0A4U1I193_9BURK|nr:hypothetical protein [Trinickia terrae]TKC86927.1 hypothetical protein FAZ69_20090 [Trinickia terrae]
MRTADEPGTARMPAFETVAVKTPAVETPAVKAPAVNAPPLAQTDRKSRGNRGSLVDKLFKLIGCISDPTEMPRNEEIASSSKTIAPPREAITAPSEEITSSHAERPAFLKNDGWNANPQVALAEQQALARTMAGTLKEHWPDTPASTYKKMAEWAMQRTRMPKPIMECAVELMNEIAQRHGEIEGDSPLKNGKNVLMASLMVASKLDENSFNGTAWATVSSGLDGIAGHAPKDTRELAQANMKAEFAVLRLFGVIKPGAIEYSRQPPEKIDEIMHIGRREAGLTASEASVAESLLQTVLARRSKMAPDNPLRYDDKAALASLMLARKTTQDKHFSAAAWAELSSSLRSHGNSLTPSSDAEDLEQNRKAFWEATKLFSFVSGDVPKDWEKPVSDKDAHVNGSMMAQKMNASEMHLGDSFSAAVKKAKLTEPAMNMALCLVDTIAPKRSQMADKNPLRNEVNAFFASLIFARKVMQEDELPAEHWAQLSSEAHGSAGVDTSKFSTKDFMQVNRMAELALKELCKIPDRDLP